MMKSKLAVQASLALALPTSAQIRTNKTNSNANRIDDADRPIHDWYRFVLSFPPHLVRQYLSKLSGRSGLHVLDPFCGTGTTVVEARLLGYHAIGIEANPVAHFACTTKVDWRPSPDRLRQVAALVSDIYNYEIGRSGNELRTLPTDEAELLLSDSISPKPLHKALVLRDAIAECGASDLINHFRLAFAKTLVFHASNLKFGPEVGVSPVKRQDVDVLGAWRAEVSAMASDLESLGPGCSSAMVFAGDARRPQDHVPARSVDVVFTSPPYPNEKDYTRTTRLESVLLGFVTNAADLRSLKQGLLRSNTRNVYKGDDDDKYVADHAEVQELAEEIERRRIALGKTSGFEKNYAKVTRQYFGGMAAHLDALRQVLRPGAKLAYVVGDQASFFQVMIRTGHLLESIARDFGYKPLGIDLFRTRLATATRAQMREEIVLLEWPG